jgi:L-threonylcarbamoyladenylate synthase
MEAIKLNKKSILQAVDFLNSGEVVIFPTDTVYGFLALAENRKAINKIYKIKKRPKTKPLPVFVKDLKMTKELAEISEKQVKTLKNKWPGKHTFILSFKKIEARPLSNLVKMGGETIALRMPKYKPLNDLLKKINKPLAQTSVNISGQDALSKISDIINQFNKSDVLILDAGNLKKSKSSKIIDLTKNKIKILRK